METNIESRMGTEKPPRTIEQIRRDGETYDQLLSAVEEGRGA